MDRKYVDEKSVADRIGLSVHTLRRDRFLGKGLPYVKVGRRCLYSLQDVDDYMESNKIFPGNDIDSHS